MELNINTLEYLRMAHFSATYECPFTCPKCFRIDPAEALKRDAPGIFDILPDAARPLDKGEQLSMLEQLVDFGIERFKITGGEPLLYSVRGNVASLVSDASAFRTKDPKTGKCSDNSLQVSIHTTGTILPSDFIEVVRENPNADFSFSLDHKDPEEVKKLQGGMRLHVLERNIERLKRAGLRFSLKTVFSGANFGFLMDRSDEFIDHIAGLGPYFWKFKAYIPTKDDNRDEYELTPEQERMFKEKYSAKLAAHHYFGGADPNLQKNVRFLIIGRDDHTIFPYVLIQENGAVYSSAHEGPEVYVGHIRQEPITVIWPRILGYKSAGIALGNRIEAAVGKENYHSWLFSPNRSFDKKQPMELLLKRDLDPIISMLDRGQI